MIIDNNLYNKISNWINKHPKSDDVSLEKYVEKCRSSLKLDKSEEMIHNIYGLVRYWIGIDDETIDENIFK